jgi:hypothetical protein
MSVVIEGPVEHLNESLERPGLVRSKLNELEAQVLNSARYSSANNNPLRCVKCTAKPPQGSSTS